MSGKKATLREMQKKKKQLRKPKSGSEDKVMSKKQSMANVGQKRKRHEDNEDESESEDDDEPEDEILQVQDNVDQREGEFNFEFSDMKNEFYGGIQLMLAKQLYSTGAAHDIAQIIIDQDELGTVVHCEGEHDVFAYATILPAGKLTSVEFFAQLATYIDHHAQATANQECKRILNSIAKQESNSSKYGLLFHDRFVNLPLELIVQLHRDLSDDLAWILDSSKRSNEITDKIVEGFENMEYVVMFRPVVPESDNSSSSSTDIKVQNVTGSSSIMFDYFEDELYFEQAEYAWKLKLDPKLFKVSNYIMMVVPKHSISLIVEGIQKILS